MTTASNLVAFRQLNQALRERGYRPFTHSKLLALSAAGHIPTYTSALRTCRGVPTRLFDPNEVIAVIESSIKPSAHRYHASAIQAKKKVKNAYQKSTGTGTCIEVGHEIIPGADVPSLEGDGRCDQSWEEAVRLLGGAGVTTGQEERILRSMHPSLRALPPEIVVRAAILEMGGTPRSGGWLRKALSDGYPRILVRAKCLRAERSDTPAQPSEHQSDARSEMLSASKGFAEPEKPRAEEFPRSCKTLDHDPSALQIWGPILTEIIPRLIPPESIQTWLAPLTAEAWDGQLLKLRSDSETSFLWITQQLEEDLKSIGISIQILPPRIRH